MWFGTSRNVISVVAAAVVAPVVAVGAFDVAKPAFSQSSGEVALVSWGGTYQDAQRKAYFEPFTKATGIRVIEGVGAQIERSRAEVASGKPSYDLAVSNQSFNLVGIDQKLWLPIDYSKFDKATLEGMPTEYRQQFGVGTIVYSEGMAISTKVFPEGQPQPSSYADFWDVKRFPGKRTLPWCDVVTEPLPEAALLADGLPADQIYPIDIDRAVKKLKELAPNIIWWRDFNQPGQYIASGEASMGSIPSGRAQVLINSGAPLKIVWNQSRYTFDVWYVLKGAPHVDNAMKFLAFVSQAQPQAELARLTSYSPTNNAALNLLDEPTAKKMPTFPDNFKNQFKKNEQWWKDNRAKWVQACQSGLM